jgi:hypothetical protein
MVECGALMKWQLEEDRSIRIKTYTTAFLPTIVLLMGFNYGGIGKQDKQHKRTKPEVNQNCVGRVT